MSDIFKCVEDWNRERNNVHYNSETEFRMLLEELLELKVKNKDELKNLSLILRNKIGSFISNRSVGYNAVEDLADAYGDIIFVAIGSLYKLGYDSKKVLEIICNANQQKGNKKDADGKIIKDKAKFVEPDLSKAKR